MQGSIDIPLNETGRQQARDAAETFALDGPVLLASSDLLRARETAELIGHHHGWGAPLTVPGLRERSFGEAEGMLTAEFVTRYGDWAAAVVPGAETWQDVRARALEALRGLATHARQLYAPQHAHVVVVSHGATIRELLRAVSGANVPATSVPNLSAHTIIMERHRFRMDAPVLS